MVISCPNMLHPQEQEVGECVNLRDRLLCWPVPVNEDGIGLRGEHSLGEGFAIRIAQNEKLAVSRLKNGQPFGTNHEVSESMQREAELDGGIIVAIEMTANVSCRDEFAVQLQLQRFIGGLL